MARKKRSAWHLKAPHSPAERRELYDRCGAKAFLEPNRRHPGKSKFPVMPKAGPCRVDCHGVYAAETRATLLRRKRVQVKARALAKKCHPMIVSF